MGGRKAKNLEGMRIGCIQVIKKVKGPNTKSSYWLTVCDCGKVQIRAASTLSRVSSCLKCAVTRSKSTEYSGVRDIRGIWKGMLARCYDPRCTAWRYYGARGIGVCLEWQKDFWCFVKDMGPRPSGYSIDRIDNTKNYCRENCRWADRQQQAWNTRRNVKITIKDETKVLPEWLLYFGISRETYEQRRRRGMSPEQAVSTPLQVGQKVSWKRLET